MKAGKSPRRDRRNAEYCSPAYHTNNILRPVLFEEMAAKVPEQAVAVEAEPHSLLQPVPERPHPTCEHAGRECQRGDTFLLQSVGNSLGTENCSNKTDSLSYSRNITVTSRTDTYTAGHVINGFTTVPESALLVYVWETKAISKNDDFQNVSIEFIDVTFHSDLIVCTDTEVELTVEINTRNDTFEILQADIHIASGIARCVEKLNLPHHEEFPSDDFDDIRLKSEDIYKILNMRGYCYKGDQQSLHSINITQNNAFVKWNKNWIAYLDSLIQLNIFLRYHSGVQKPKFIRHLQIDVDELTAPRYNTIRGEDGFNAQVDTHLDITRCTGVNICGIIFDDKMTVTKEPSIIRDRRFYPYLATEKVNTQTALEVMLQIVVENSSRDIINLVYSLKMKNELDVHKKIQDVVDNMPDFKFRIQSLSIDKNNDNNAINLHENATTVLVCENIFGGSEGLSSFQNNTTKDDFILAQEHRIPNNIHELKHNFSVLACMSDGKHILMLLKKIEQYKNVSIVPVTSLEINFSWISKVKKELAVAEKVVLVSENLSYSGVLGFVQKLRKDENRNLSLIAILDDDQKFDVTNEFYRNQLDKNMAVNVLKKGQWGGYYSITCDSSVNLRNFTLKSSAAGNIEGLIWTENSPCFNKNNLVQVSFSAVSVYDCQKAMDMYSNNCSNNSFGMDFSGIDGDGDRIMGLIAGGATSSSIEADPALLWPVPEHWALEDAATVPLPYALAYYCLNIRHKLNKGQTVLVTNGSDPLSQAIISLCLAADCTVFTTVTTEQQKKFLLRLFPKIKENNIVRSDVNTLCSTILKNTNNKGCDLVINTFTGTLCEAGIKCVGVLGTFLDLNTHDIHENQCIAASVLGTGKHYKIADFMNIYKAENIADRTLLQYHIATGISTGSVCPLPRVVLPPAEVVRAFRLLSRGTSPGRVLLKLRDPSIMNQGLKVTPILTFNPQDVVIVVCDESGFGVALTDRLIERGAKKIILHIDTTCLSGYVQYMFISWSKKEVSVELSSENLCARRGCETLMKKAMKFGKLKALFIVLDEVDANVRDEFTDAYNKMCSVALNFDSVTRSCSSLSYFTVVCGAAASAGAEYAASVLQRGAELRRAASLPALVVRHSLHQYSKYSMNPSNNLEPQTFDSFFSALEISLKKKYLNVTTFNTKKKESFDFRKTVAKILGVSDIEDLQNETTLQDLNLNGIPLKELRTAIKSAYQIDYPLQQISRMTIQSLKELKQLKLKTINYDSGIAAFYKQIFSKEEHLMLRPIVILPSHSMNVANPENEIVIMIPGFEGHCTSFQAIAEKLKAIVFGINVGPDFEGKTIDEIAKNIRKLLSSCQVEIKAKFHILGYSFGVNIALELAALFEQEGIVGNVYCLDSSPQVLSSQIETYYEHLSENELQDLILSHMYKLITLDQHLNIMPELENVTCFEDKLNLTLKMLKSKISYSQQYMRHLLESAYRKIQLARKFEPKMKLQSELILLKGTVQPKAIIAEDYNLSHFSEKPIKIFEINSHSDFVYANAKISEIMNDLIK